MRMILEHTTMNIKNISYAMRIRKIRKSTYNSLIDTDAQTQRLRYDKKNNQTTRETTPSKCITRNEESNDCNMS